MMIELSLSSSSQTDSEGGDSNYDDYLYYELWWTQN